jgi:hypothetical protein|tara:strand:+ start:1873 stop:2553 length:681 start_codon:yes stop_codon:yes gene_type:complete
MATSGTTSFNLDFTEIAEEAWERAGRAMRSGYDLRTARRSMNLMLIEWQNKGLNMWTIDEGQVALVKSQVTYPLPADTIDLLEHVLRTGAGSSQTDLSMSRISVSTYSTIPNKLTEGRPLQILINRLETPSVTVWPVPNNGTYTLRYWRMRRIQDAGAGIETSDMTFRFYPALVAGLAYHIAMKVPELAPRIDMLKAVYDEQYNMAASEDREKATWSIVPRVSRLR